MLVIFAADTDTDTHLQCAYMRSKKAVANNSNSSSSCDKCENSCGDIGRPILCFQNTFNKKANTSKISICISIYRGMYRYRDKCVHTRVR